MGLFNLFGSLFSDDEDEKEKTTVTEDEEEEEIDHAETYTDIPDYAGYCPDCPNCGTEMGYSYGKNEFKCPDCGYILDEADWDYEAEKEDEIPWACQTCGGPYPDCQSSCNLFDE